MTISEPRKTSSFAFFPRIITSLKNPSYRIYFLASVSHFAALSMTIVCNPMLIYRITGSKALLGTMALVSALPMIAVSIFGGAIADRIQKKKIVLACLLGSAVVSFLVGLALLTDTLSSENSSSWWILFASAAIQGSIMGLMMPGMMAIIPEIVNREQLLNAIALNTMGMNVLSLIAPGVAGFIIGDANNFKAVYFTMVGLYICASIFIMFVPAKSQIVATTNKIIADIQKGFQYIRKDSLILLVLAFVLIVTILAMPYQQLMPIFADDILKVGAQGMGILLSVSGAGALVGSLVLATLPNKKRGLLLISSGILAGISLLVFSFSSYITLSLIFMFFVGVGQTFRMTVGSALLQAYSEEAYMGRVMSILNIQWGLMSVCTFVAGLLAEVFNVQWVMGSLAIILIIFSIFFLILSPGIRKLD